MYITFPFLFPRFPMTQHGFRWLIQKAFGWLTVESNKVSFHLIDMCMRKHCRCNTSPAVRGKHFVVRMKEETPSKGKWLNGQPFSSTYWPSSNEANHWFNNWLASFEADGCLSFKLLSINLTPEGSTCVAALMPGWRWLFEKTKF